MLAYKRSPNFGTPATFSTIAYEPTQTPTSSSTHNFDFPSSRGTTSPPVILAFLAIGMFAAAMLALFGCRRVNLERRWMVNQRRGGVVGLTPGDGQERPRLWDLGSAPGVIGGGRGWKDIMPVAAHRIVEVPAKDRGGRGSVWGGADGVGVLRTRTLVRALEHWRESLPRPFFKHVVEITSPEVVEEGRLQVAVPIAMPCPHRPRLTCIRESTDGSDEKTADSSHPWEDERGLVYAIGLLDVSCRKPASGLDDR